MAKIQETERMLFISDYPDEETIKEGMLQRVKAIDIHFESVERSYLSVSVRHNTKKKTRIISDNCISYKVNFFLHFFFITSLLFKASEIYIHSAYNAFQILPILLFSKRKKLIWDVHGAVSEEELINGKFISSKIYRIIEQFLLSHSKVILVVTDQLKHYLLSKYSTSHLPKFIKYPILPDTLFLESKSFLPIPEDKVVIIYTGGTQKWQNIDLMIRTIKSNLHENFLFIILTGNLVEMKEYLNEYGILGNSNILLDSVPPDHLPDYYVKANYGFILRDDIVVNQVACPTKLVEYMSYGIVPIIKSENVGDFKELGYENIYYDNINKDLKKAKSEKNKKIINNLVSQTKDINLLHELQIEKRE